MSLTPTVDSRSRVGVLNRDIAAGRIIGRAANIDRERRFLETVKERKGCEVKAIAVTGETSFVESVIDFIDTRDQHVHVEQVSVAYRKNGRIVYERFCADSAAR